MADIRDFTVIETELADTVDPVVLELLLNICRSARDGKVTAINVTWLDEGGDCHAETSMGNDPLRAAGMMHWAANEFLTEVC